jgi:hypothetical protein
MFDYQVIYLWKQDKNTKKEIQQINKLLYILHKLTSNITLKPKLP